MTNPLFNVRCVREIADEGQAAQAEIKHLESHEWSQESRMVLNQYNIQLQSIYK